MNVIDVGPLQLAYCFVFIVIAGAGRASGCVAARSP